MELSELRVFLKVAAERSFSRAAMKLHRTQREAGRLLAVPKRGVEDSNLFLSHGTPPATVGRIPVDGTGYHAVKMIIILLKLETVMGHLCRVLPWN